MEYDHAEHLCAMLERIAVALEAISERLDKDRADKDRAEEEKVILEERIAEAEARRNHPSRYVP